MPMRYDAGEVITAMITPFDENRQVEYNQVEKLADYLADNGSDGILIAGTTGESPTLTHEEEFEQIPECALRRHYAEDLWQYALQGLCPMP